MTEVTTHCAIASTMTGPSPTRSAIHPPTNTPASSATVPPTTDIEFAINRSSCGTRRGNDGDRGGEEEPVHGEDPQRAHVEGDGRVERVEQHEPRERRAKQWRDHEDPATRPPIDEDAGERADDREGERHDQRRDREPECRALLLGVEHDRGDERHLEQPSADCDTRRIAKSRRKSSLRNASRARCRVGFTAGMVGAGLRPVATSAGTRTIAPKSSSPSPPRSPRRILPRPSRPSSGRRRRAPPRRTRARGPSARARGGSTDGLVLALETLAATVR